MMQRHLFPYPVLVADVGGTNARFAVAAAPGQALSAIVRRPTGGHANFSETVRDAVRVGGFPSPRSFLVAVAGPVNGLNATLTNAETTSGRLVLDGPSLARTLDLDQGILFNDFEALSLSLPFLNADDLLPLGGGRSVGGTRAVVGPGTGLGVGALLEADGKFLPLASEGGHMSLGPQTPEEWAVWSHLGRPDLKGEDLISGRGLHLLYRAICTMHGTSASHADAATVTAAALADDDAMARTAAVIFLHLLGRFAGDVALAVGAKGGVFIGGGITPRLRDLITMSQMRSRFDDKGPLSSYMRAIPLHLILADAAALTGLAAVAADPDRFRLDYPDRLWRPV